MWAVSLAVPQMYAYLFSASETVTAIVKRYTPFFLMGSVMFFVQMTLQNINVALGQARSALLLAVTRKVIILIPLCFLLTHFLGFRGVYLSEGIADFIAGIITSIVIFTTFPRIFRKREEEVRRAAAGKAVLKRKSGGPVGSRRRTPQSELSRTSLFRKNREMHQRAASPTMAKMIRLNTAPCPPKMAPTKSNPKIPMEPQFNPPMITSASAILSSIPLPPFHFSEIIYICRADISMETIFIFIRLCYDRR